MLDMEKVKIKVTAKQLGVLVFHFKTLGKEPSKERNVRVAKSVLSRVQLKMAKKQLETDQQPTLFTKIKHITFSLEFFEAHFLETFLVLLDEHPMNDYDRNVIRLVRSHLNQKLA
jgi:hypothetical protein